MDDTYRWELIDMLIETGRTNGVQITIDVEIERAKELLAELAAAIQKAEENNND